MYYFVEVLHLFPYVYERICTSLAGLYWTISTHFGILLAVWFRCHSGASYLCSRLSYFATENGRAREGSFSCEIEYLQS